MISRIFFCRTNSSRRFSSAVGDVARIARDRIGAHHMLLTPGTRLGPYEIESLIGSGSMGEVSQGARWTLNRTIAIKRLNC